MDRFGYATAVSSRGLGHGPLKAGTRVRIPLPLFAGVSLAGEVQGAFVYRFRTAPFHGAETGSTPVRAMEGLTVRRPDRRTV